MKIGFPNHPRRNVIDEIEWIGRNGFDFVDLFLEEDMASPDKVDIQQAKKSLKKYKLGVVGHTAWYLPIGSPSQSFRRLAVEEAAKCFAVFSELGAELVTVHANWAPKMFTVSEGLEFQVETLKELVSEAGSYGINLMYEPLDTARDTVENTLKILDSVPGLYLHLDTGHANLHGRNPEQFVKEFHGKLRHIHLHDNFGDRDSHLPVGTGNIDWQRFIKVLKRHYDGTITLEIFSNDRDYVLLSREKLQALWGR